MSYKIVRFLSVLISIALLSGFSFSQDQDSDEQHDHADGHAEHHDHAMHAEHHANGASHESHHAEVLAQTQQRQSPFESFGLDQPSAEFTTTHSRLVIEAELALAEASDSTEIVKWPYELASDDVKAQYDYNREAIKGLVPLYKLAMQEEEGSVLVKVLEDMADHWYAIRRLHAENLSDEEMAQLDQIYNNRLNREH